MGDGDVFMLELVMALVMALAVGLMLPVAIVRASSEGSVLLGESVGGLELIW